MFFVKIARPATSPTQTTVAKISVTVERNIPGANKFRTVFINQIEQRTRILPERSAVNESLPHLTSTVPAEKRSRIDSSRLVTPRMILLVLRHGTPMVTCQTSGCRPQERPHDWQTCPGNIRRRQD